MRHETISFFFGAMSAAAIVVLLLRKSSGRHTRKPRIGLVHGGSSNPSIFRKQISKLLTVLGDEVELVDLTGTLLSDDVRKDERGLANMALMRKVFGADQVLYEHAITQYDAGRFYYSRADEGVVALEAQIREHGPVDVLLGFSQGANFSSILAARACAGLACAAPPFRALVLLENDPPAWPSRNFPTVFPPAAPLLPTPALLVGGTSMSAKTDEVGGFFANASHERHTGGHRPLPKDPKECATLVHSIQTFVHKHCMTL